MDLGLSGSKAQARGTSSAQSLYLFLVMEGPAQVGVSATASQGQALPRGLAGTG